MKILFIIILGFVISSCHEYSDDMANPEAKQGLSNSFGPNYSDWKMYDSNNNEITFDHKKYDHIPKIMKVDVKVISKTPQSSTIFMWYGGPDNNNSDGETPMTYNPINLVSTVNLGLKDQEYKIFPPQNGVYRAWSIPSQPIAFSNINNENTVSINLYLEPKTYLSIVKKDIYLINTNNSFVERRYKTNYGIYGGLTYGMKFTKHQTLRRVVINAHSPYTNSDINFDSDFVSVSKTYE